MRSSLKGDDQLQRNLIWGRTEGGLPALGRMEIELAIIGDSIGTDSDSCSSFWAAMRFLDLGIEEEGSARELYFSIENGLEQSRDGASIFSKIP